MYDDRHVPPRFAAHHVKRDGVLKPYELTEGQGADLTVLDLNPLVAVLDDGGARGSGVAVGFEALTRFADGRSPDVALADAEATGRAVELDAALVRSAVAAAVGLPVGTWVSINVSAALAGVSITLEATLA